MGQSTAGRQNAGWKTKASCWFWPCDYCLAEKENWLLPAKQSLPPFHHLLQESKLCHAGHKSFLCCLSAISYSREAWITSSWTPAWDTCTHTGALPVNSGRLFLAYQPFHWSHLRSVCKVHASRIQTQSTWVPLDVPFLAPTVWHTHVHAAANKQKRCSYHKTSTVCAGLITGLPHLIFLYQYIFYEGERKSHFPFLQGLSLSERD